MSRNDVCKCIFASNQKSDYITIILKSKIEIYDGYNFIFEIEIENVSGAVYFDGILYYTIFDENCIYLCASEKIQSKIIINNYKEVKLLKYLNNTFNWFVLQVDNEKFIVYDTEKEQKLFNLPLQDDFTDLAIIDNNRGIMIGCEAKDVSVYEDDMDIEYIILCSFTYNIFNAEICILDTFGLFQDGSFEYGMQIISGENLKLPNYAGRRTKEKSISSNGKYFIYYSDESKRVVISKAENAEIFRIFILPIDISEDAKLYFNDYTNIFTVVDAGNIEQYFVSQSNELIEKLNNGVIESTNIENEVYKVMFSTQCINLKEKYEYDVALSFAGEDRQYVEKIAEKLKDKKLKVFYDKFETVSLWGKDLYQYLSHIYKDTAKYCVIFVSRYYKEKAWTKHELRNAQNRAFLDNKEYILPIFLEHVELEGLNATIGYLNADEFSDDQIVQFIIEKVNKR